MRTKRIVFLDFDGVLVNRESWYVRSGLQATAHPSCVEALNHVTEHAGAEIVVTSTWRIGVPAAELRGTLRKWKVTAAMLGVTPVLRAPMSRGDEILAWLQGNRDRYDVLSFVILDDESDMGVLKDRLIKTDFEFGLTMQHAEQAIQMLQNANAEKVPPASAHTEEHQEQKTEGDIQ